MNRFDFKAMIPTFHGGIIVAVTFFTHVRCDDGECKFWLEPVLLVSNREISPHDLREIERHVFENKKLLLDNYNEYYYL